MASNPGHQKSGAGIPKGGYNLKWETKKQHYLH